MFITIYAYYGVLAHEKRPVYSPYHVNGEICEELAVDIPVPMWRNIYDEPGVTLDGNDYLLKEVLTNWGDAPALVWVNDAGKKRHLILRTTIMARAAKLAESIRNADTWNPDDLAELCELAGMTDEWEAADGDTFESVAYAAAKKLGVEIV